MSVPIMTDMDAKEIIRTVPGRGYQLGVAVAELSGVAGPSERPVWRRHVAALAAILVLALAAALWWAVPREAPRGEGYRPSIAVVPFRNIKLLPMILLLDSSSTDMHPPRMAGPARIRLAHPIPIQL